MILFSTAPGAGTGQQRGSTLLVALIMLVLLTLIALSAMKSTTSSIQVVGNAQFREEAKAAGQKAIELVLSDDAFLTATTAPDAQTINIGGTAYTVTFEKPTCLSAIALDSTDATAPPMCASSGGFVACYWTRWEIEATVSNTQTGASLILHQGLRTLAKSNSVQAAGCTT